MQGGEAVIDHVADLAEAGGGDEQQERPAGQQRSKGMRLTFRPLEADVGQQDGGRQGQGQSGQARPQDGRPRRVDQRHPGQAGDTDETQRSPKANPSVIEMVRCRALQGETVTHRHHGGEGRGRDQRHPQKRGKPVDEGEQDGRGQTDRGQDDERPAAAAAGVDGVADERIGEKS